jgi:succinate-acetate transporter protein
MLLVVFGVFWLFFVGILGAVKEALTDDAVRETEAAAAHLLVTDN